MRRLVITTFKGTERLPLAGALILLSSPFEIETASLAGLSGRATSVWFDQVPLEDAAMALRRGEIVVMRADALSEAGPGLAALNPAAAHLIAREIDFQIVPAAVEAKTRTLYVGSPLLRAETSVERLRTALYDLGAAAFRQRPDLGHHLGYECLRGLKRKWFQPVFIDGFLDGRVLKGGMLVALAWELSAWIRKHVPEKRIGLVLAPGFGGAVGNLGAVFADKTPVNLNFTAGRALNQAALEKGRIRAVVSVAPMREKLKDFPWPEGEGTIDLKELMLGFPKWRIALRWAVATLLPAAALRALIGVPRAGGDKEAALLFTSGSVGEPKGVVLTHRNILGNTAQTDAVLSGVPVTSMLGCLPIFHSFGCTVTFWWPMLGGPMAVTYINPMETAKLAELVEKYRIGLLLTTPTFLKNFLRKTDPAQLGSLRLIVTGAEKLPQDLALEMERKFGVPVCEGFGMTEATPVVSVNLVDYRRQPGDPAYEGPRRRGSVGRLIPGLSVRIRHPETGERLPFNQTGMIWLRGVNIFPGYLDDPARTTKVLENGWYQTGDLGRLDDDGFLFIEGRLTRFSKLAGEMVPHGTVEEAIAAAFPELGEEFRPVVMGVEDAGKGEALVILSPVEFDLQAMRTRLAEKGVPNLWIPRRLQVVPEIPRLATGKVDLGACRKLAESP